MDVTTTDHRAWGRAPHLVLVRASGATLEWTDPETGTTCRLDASGDFVVLRRVGERVAPVVAGQILPDEAASVFEDPESVRSRRAAAHAIVAVDAAARG